MGVPDREAESGGMPSGRVAFGDLSRRAQSLRAELLAALETVLDSGRYVLGPHVTRFEAAFAEVCRVPFATGVASGTDALELALRSVGVRPGHEVITQANTCVPTVAAIVRAGATPVLCDVELTTGLMDARSVRDAISARTAALVPVHLYGQAADMNALGALAAEYGIAVVEDCAHGHGLTLAGRVERSLGCFSFYPTKNLGGLGDAGAVVGADPELMEAVAALRCYGEPRDQLAFASDAAGFNSRLDELQAAILLVELDHLQRWNERRRAIVARYDQALADTAVRSLRRLVDRPHLHHLYVVRVARRDRFRVALLERGVESKVHYAPALHRHPRWGSFVHAPVPLRSAEALAEQVVSLPLYPELRDEEISRVAESARHAALELSPGT